MNRFIGNTQSFCFILMIRVSAVRSAAVFYVTYISEPYRRNTKILSSSSHNLGGQFEFGESPKSCMRSTNLVVNFFVAPSVKILVVPVFEVITMWK